jgi:hypothetical protein
VAARDLAPASTAATSMASTVASACRRPRRFLGLAMVALPSGSAVERGHSPNHLPPSEPDPRPSAPAVSA